MPVLALLSMTVAADADSPTSAIQISDVHLVHGDAVGARNDCWADAPMGAVVLCATPWPEVRQLRAVFFLKSAPSSDVVIEYESMDLTATGGTDYVALDGTLTIPAGELRGAIDIDFIDDLVEEGNETFVVKITAPESISLEHDYIHVTIIDEESIRITVSDSSGNEGYPSKIYTDVGFSDSVFWPYSIRVWTTAGTAGPDDYVEPYHEISIGFNPPLGVSIDGFRVTHYLIDDSIDEPAETYTLFMQGRQNLSMDVGSGTLTIIDNDGPPSLSVADVSGLEDSVGNLSFTVTLNPESGKDVSLYYATADGTATAGSDYAQMNGTLTFSAGETTKMIDVPVLEDGSPEEDETFTVTLSNAVNATIGDGAATGTIQDDDPVPTALSIEDVEGLESSGALEFPVTLTGDREAGTTVTVDYATADGTATAGSDYAQMNGTLTFSAGETTKTIDVPVLEDGSPEEDETFTVTLSNAVNATIGDGTGTGTIQDDDPVPTALSIEDVEGLESSGGLEFPVTLTGDREAGTTITVDYATSDGTGTAGSDYTETMATLTFASDVTRQTIRVPLLDDAVDEPDETFVVTLSNSSGAMLDDSEATGTIRDNDATSTEITLTATPARVLEDAGATVVAVTATLDAGARTEATEVAVAVSGSGNADAVDFQDVSSFTITIAAGDESGTNTFTLTPIDDEVDELNETLTVTGTSILTVIVTEVELVDDDATSSSIALTAEPPRVSEGDGATPVRVTATLDAGARTEATTVTVTVSGSGNADAVDFNEVQDFTVTIAAGDTSGSGTFTLTPEDDEVDESDETLTVTGTSILTVIVTEVELVDDDATSSSIALTAEPPRVSEGDGATPVRVTATLDAGARTEETTVTVTVSGSGNADAVDFNEVQDFTVTIAAGDTSGSGTFTLTPEDDNVDESDETLNVDGSSVLPVTADTVALADDDQPSAAILLSASPGRIAEDGGARSVQVTATLDASARAVATTVSVSVAGSGRPDAVDYSASTTAFDITIAAGATIGTETFTVTPEDDEVDERDEVLDIAGTSDLPVTSTSVTLADDEVTSTEIVLSAAPSTVSEGAGATPIEVTATLDAGARTVPTTVTVEVTGSGDPDAVDFASVRDFTIMIAAGDTSGSGTFTLTPEDDNVDESDETLTVDGSSVLPVTADTVALADDDQPSAAILLSASPGRIAEDGGASPVQVTATLDASARTVATTVSVSVSGSGQPDAVDYAATATAFDITIAAGATAGTGTFTVTPEDDEVDERDEVLDIAGTSNLPVTPASVTLADDDQTSTEIVLSAVPSTVSEGAGATPVEVTATLDAGARTVSTTVAVTVSGSGNADAVDFADVRDFTIMIAAGATSGRATFTLTPEDDNVAESSETVTVDGRSDIPVTQTSVTLTDDDVASSGIVLSASPSLVSEDGGAVGVRVTASLNGAVSQAATTVSVSVAGSGNPRAVDFQPVADFTITIAANAASGEGTFTLTPRDDATAEADETLTVSGASDLPVTPTTVTLADDDDPSTRILLSAVPERVSEGDGPTSVTVTATLDRALRQQATAVTVSVSGSGDAGAADFEAVADFSITIPANAASGEETFTLTPRDDATAEADETLTMSGASDLPVTPTTVTLADDDDPSTRILLSAVPERVSEGDGPTSVTVTATLDRALRQQATAVTVSVSGSGDAGAADFEAVADFSITIPANAASGEETFTLTPRDDATAEADETLTMSGASDLPVTPTTVTLADDDDPSTRILLSAVPERVSEGDGPTPVTVTATLDRALRQQATAVTVSVSGSGDAGAADFAAVRDFAITIPANAASGTGTFTLTPEDDAMVESDETLTVSGASDLPVTPAAVTLADDDEVSTRILLFLTVDPPRASEGDGEILVTVTAEVDRGVRPDESRIRVSVSGSGDPNAVDFAAVTDFEVVIPANAPNGSGTFTVVPEDDLIVEADELLTISGVSDLPVSPATLELLDDDEASTRILLSADPARVSEGGGPVTVTVTASLDRGLRQSATNVTVSVSGSGDADAVDFAAVADFGITIKANAPSGTGTFTLTPEDDAEDEADETLALTGESDLPVRSASVVLADDDEMASRVLSIADAEAAEGAGEVRFVVTLDGPSAAEVTVGYATADPAGSVDPVAGAGVDYESASGTLTFAPGEVSRTIGVSVIDDSLDEPDETFTLVLADPRGARLGRGSALGTIRDDDEMTSRVLSIADAEAAESAGEVRFAVTLDGPSPAEVTVSYATADPAGSVDPAAGAGIDYESASGTLTFAPGEVSQTIRVQVLDDELDEPDETFALVLSDLRGAALGRGSALGTIRDDDEMASRVLSIADAEASESAGEMPFVVALDGPSAVEVTVSYATADLAGSVDPVAGAGIDYESASGTLTFAPGEVSQTIRVQVLDDELDEPDETFALVLSDLRGAALGRGSALGTIRDDDEPPALSIAGDTGPEDVGELVFSVTLMARARTEVTVNYATMDDTAIAGDDYVPVEGTLTFAPGETAKTIRVAVVDDAVDEADEEIFAVTLSGHSGATLAHSLATGVIRDDDEPPALSVADAAGDEDVGALEFEVTLSAPSGIEVSVAYATTDGTATAGSDYATAAGTLVFAPGETSRTIRVAIFDDAVHEADEESFAVTLSGHSGATLAHSLATGVIRDDDEPPALSVADAAGDEDVGALEFEVTLSAPSGIEVSVAYATTDGTATAGSDYTTAAGTLVFAPGETSRTIRVAIFDDAVHEADEEIFAVTLSGHSGATLAHSLATGVIRDDDEPPALSVADAAGDEDVGALEFEVTLSAPSGIEVSVAYATTDGSATAESDYAAAMGTLVFAPGETSRTIRVAILDDAVHEADEEIFELSLSELQNATAADVSATGTIRDNDLAPPAVAGDLPAALLCVGGAPYELDLGGYFDGKELRFSAVSATPRVATATLDGSRLTVAPASEGESSVTVTASNDAGSASGSIGVRVVTDPAELEAVESVLASIGRAVLTGVTDSVRARFGPRSAIGEQSASTNVQRGRTQVVPGASAVLGNQWPGPAMHGTRSGGWDGSGFFEPQVSGDDWFETMNRSYRRGMVPFSFSLDSAQSASTGPAWAVWGRADAHRFESGIDGNSHDGTLTAVHLGADARVGDWLAGVSVARSAAEADYRFERSVDACGGGGVGDGMVDAELTSVHPYVGRQIGRGSVWATLGAGSGEVSVERCETGRRNETDLSMRLAALGGRHPFAGGERIEVSVVEEISVLDLTTGDAPGPVGDRSVSVGQARLGLEATGVATPGCDCSLTTFVRAFARGDWGDGATGGGLELAAGVRFRNLPQRLGIDAGIRALAVHSAEDASEQSANLTFSILPKADGTGWQASLAWRRGTSDARLAALGGNSPWTAPSGSLPGAESQWIAESRLGYGIAVRRGSATPFVEFDAGHSGRGGARFGVRHEFGDRARGLVVEWGIEPSSFGNAGSRIHLEALGRF